VLASAPAQGSSYFSFQTGASDNYAITLSSGGGASSASVNSGGAKGRGGFSQSSVEGTPGALASRPLHQRTVATAAGQLPQAASSSLTWTLFSDPGYTNEFGTCPSGNCLVSLNANTTYYLRVDNSATLPATFTMLVKVSQQQGFFLYPQLLSISAPFTATVDANGYSFYEFLADVTGTETISLTGSNTQIGFAVFSDPEFSQPLLVCADFSAGDDQSCSLSVTSSQFYYLLLHEFLGKNGNTMLTVGDSEGSISKPVALNLGSTYAGSVDANGNSYYTFTIGQSGDYTIATTNPSSVVDWYLYSDAAFSSLVASCNIQTDSDFTAFEGSVQNCPLTLNAGTYYLRVQETLGRDGTYTLLIPGQANEGSVTAPVPLTVGTPRNSTVDAMGTSYYVFTTANDSISGTVNEYIDITNSTSPIMGWRLFTDPAFSKSSFSCGGFAGSIPNPSCSVALNPGVTYYLVAEEAAGQPSTFTLTVTASEGTATAPIAVTLDHYTDSSVDGFGTSYYTFTTVKPGSYAIGMSGLFTQLLWTLYSDAAFSNQVASCSYATLGTNPECPVTLPGSAQYYLKVEEASGDQVSFDMVVSSGADNQGSVVSPFAVNPFAPGAGPNLTVSSFQQSYYSFNSGSPAHPGDVADVYSIVTYPYQQDMGWTIYSDANFQNSVLTCHEFHYPGTQESCRVTLTPNTTYYLSVDSLIASWDDGDFFELNASNLGTAGGGTSEGAVGSPVTLSIGKPENSQGIQVAAHGQSYYSFTAYTGESTGPYEIMSPGLLGWNLYSDSGFQNLLAACPSVARSPQGQWCVTPALVPGTVYFLQVTNDTDLAVVPSQFQLIEYDPVNDGIHIAPFLPDGTPSTPVPLNHGLPGQSSSLSVRAPSYYSFTVSQSGTYVISATIPTGPQLAADYAAAWSLFSDPGFNHQIGQCIVDQAQRVTSPETTCSVFMTPGSYYLMVTDEVPDNNGANLVISITP
jgi:hypothetical protein